MPVLFAEAYFHTMDPFAIQFTEDFGIRWYGLAYLIGFVIAWWFVRWVSRRGWSPIAPAAVGDLIFAVIIGVVLGGRLGYALFYQPELFITFSNSVPFWDLLAINKGGMASHGGMIGVIIACIVFARSHAIPSLHLLDVGAVGAAPGLGIGRIANFINGELHGRPVPNQIDPPWWSMKVPQELHEWGPDRLADLRDVVDHVGISPTEWTMAVQSISATTHPPAEAMQLVNWGIKKLIAATQQGNEVVIEGLRPLLTAFYPSQIFQAITDGPLLLAILILIWLKPRKPGVVGSWFLIAYGVMRIATEMFREPDQGVALLMGLSRGQVLSVLMVLVGLATLVICSRRDVPRMGGLFARQPHEAAR